MTFNISQFKSEMDKRGGPARGNLFEITIAPLSDGATDASGNTIEARTLSFFCKNAQIPAITFNTTSYASVGQMERQFTVGVTVAPVSLIFMVDSDHEILNYFHQWMQKIVNHGNGPGSFDAVDGRLPYEIGYKDEYASTITIRHYSTESVDDKYYEVVLYNAHPFSIGDLDLAWEDNDSYLTLPVGFSYDNILYSGTKTGIPNNRASNGTGLLDSLGALAGFGSVIGQTVNQGFRFDTVQDAVNRISRVRNSFDNLSNKI